MLPLLRICLYKLFLLEKTFLHVGQTCADWLTGTVSLSLTFGRLKGFNCPNRFVSLGSITIDVVN